MTGDWTAVGPADGADGDVRDARVGGTYVALARADGQWYAFSDECSHEECILSEGDLEGTAIVCDCHGSQFDVRTGEVLTGPATEPIATYPVRIVDGRIELQV